MDIEAVALSLSGNFSSDKFTLKTEANLQVNQINDKVNFISDELTLNNEFSNNENLEKLSEEISDINHNNQKIWQN